MEETQPTSTALSTEIATSAMSRYSGLIDIPLSYKIIDSLTSLFNYFDIYAPKMNFFHIIVTFFRFFQLIGGAFMAGNTSSFAKGTLSYSAVSILTIFFHVVPLEYRYGNAVYILYAFNGFLILFGIYLVVTAFVYKSTSKVPKVSCILLSIFMAFGPFLCLPIIAQFTAQMLSAFISGAVKAKTQEIIMIIVSVIDVVFYLWILIKSYSVALVFRPMSFASIEGSPQTKLLITTIVVTFVSSLTSYFGPNPSAAMMAISILCYIYSSTTVFNCGTYINRNHQVLVLSGSITGIILCIANLFMNFDERPWGPEFFVGLIAVLVVTFLCVGFFIKKRGVKELRLLDEIEESQDITIIKKKNKLKQMLSTGYSFNHPCCLNFSIFKLAISQWKDAVDIWALYAKFIAIYPESGPILAFIAQNVASLKSKDTLADVILNSTSYVIKTRETKFTPQLKNRISKLSKHFMKTKNRLRNIWDLVLQGNINEMATAIKRTQENVSECEVEITHLTQQYPNNRFVFRQYLMFIQDIKGDPVAAKTARENLIKLQRGIPIIDDTVHGLGIQAYPHMPTACIDSSGLTKQITESESLEEINFTDEDNMNLDAIEQISKQIDHHKVPAITFMYKSTIFLYIFVILIPLLVLILGFTFYKTEIQKPINFMQGISYTRTYMAMLSALVGRYLFRNIDDPKIPGHKMMDTLELINNFNLDELGSSTKTSDMMKFIANKISSSNAMMSQLRSFKLGNEYTEKVRELLFTNNHCNFTLYFNISDKVVQPSDIPSLSFMLVNHVGKLLSISNPDYSVASSMDALTTRNNNYLPNKVMGDALRIMLEYLMEQNNTLQLVFDVCLYFILCFVIFIYPLFYYLQIRKLRKNRYEILSIMTTLPKTVISTISSSFKSKDTSSNLSSQNSDVDSNRQEESIIKLFSSISDGSSKASIELANLFLFLIIVILGCLSYYVSIKCYITSANNLIFNSYHINYLFASNTYLFSVVARIFKIALAKYDVVFKDSVVSIDSEISRMKETIPKVVEYFQNINLGGPDSRQVPFPEMAKIIDVASEELVCPGELKPPHSVTDSVHCFKSDQQYYVATALILKYYSMMQKDVWPSPKDKDLQDLWQIGPIELFQTFFSKAMKIIVPTIVQGIENQNKRQIMYTSIFLVLTFLLTIVIILIVKKEEILLKFCLKLLLRCPPQSLLNNSRVMDLLGGNYNFTSEDVSDKHIWFSNEVVNRLNDVIIVCQEETSKIITVNAAFEEMFDIKQSEIENKTFKEFFTEEKFSSSDKLDKVFSQPISVVFTDKNENKIYLEFSSSCVSGRRIFSGSNQTQNVMHEKLIADEKKKSDSMLASILPPMLVPRVQSGEKNISFSVKSVTVLFLDVVEFTPWCGSHDAQYVMRMLNIMFKEFDAITNAHKTMTKIKCIGDCYMAAGGIFDEVNQPSVHAKEVVDFGCLVINKLLEIDESESESLRIRVGINTGGPIVAGVIGTEKPTFEILGPAINIAHEMEHHGVPMKVHISRPVYELIYGQSFDIKERGEIDVKGGKMFTYLVEP